MAKTWVLTDSRYLKQRMPQALIDELSAHSVPNRLVVADDHLSSLGTSDTNARHPFASLEPNDVVVARTRNRFALSLLREAERPGVTVMTPWKAVAALRNKARATQLLTTEGVPIPETFLADRVEMLRDVPRRHFPLILKPHLGDNARGISIVNSHAELDDLNWSDGMVLAQRYIDAGSIDIKLYVAGERVWSVRRSSPLIDGSDRYGERVDLTPELERIARLCSSIFKMPLIGVDAIQAPSGPLVVDVNDFPNYTGIQEAPGAIADLVAGRCTQEERATPDRMKAGEGST